MSFGFQASFVLQWSFDNMVILFIRRGASCRSFKSIKVFSLIVVLSFRLFVCFVCLFVVRLLLWIVFIILSCWMLILVCCRSLWLRTGSCMVRERELGIGCYCWYTVVAGCDDCWDEALFSSTKYFCWYFDG